MELVYLWVEDYKNIKNQGFNFSPRFTCKYENGKLTIHENKEYVSIFTENVNVTAIVGENGSGKSSIVDFILDLDGWISTDKRLLFVLKNDKDLKCYTLNFPDNITSNIKQEKINREKARKNGAISSYGLKFSFLSLSPFLPKLDSYYANSINLYSIFNYRTTYESRAFHYNSFMQSILSKIPQLVEHTFINTFFNFKGKPKYFVFKYNKEIEKNFQSEFETILSKSSIKEETDKTCIRQIEIYNDIFVSLMELNKKVEDRKEELKNKLNELNNSEKKKKIINFQKNELFDRVNMVTDMKENRNNQKIKEISEEIKSIGSIDFFLSFDESSKDEFHFSTGELVMLYYIKALLEINNEENNSIVIIDESELFLHPAWQKKFIYLLNEIFDNYNYKRQIIISSHSPFILSDLPKENVIFLKEGKQVYPDIDTFGANIHTLLSHGFFMDGGLMGEFAKEKINEVIEFHKKVEQQKEDEIKKEELKTKYEEKKKEFWHVQSIIGEDYLKQVIKNHLVEIEKLLLGKDEAKNAEIARLKEQIELLESKNA